MKKYHKHVLVYLFLISLLLPGACERPAEADICVSIPPQAYLVKRIIGDEQTIGIMIPPGSAPPTYSPTPSQIRDLHNCKLYVKLGHPDFLFEKKHIDPYLKKHANLRVVNMADSLDIIPGDVHIWLSPAYMRIAARRIYAALKEVYPDRQDELRQNYLLLSEDINTLDKDLQKIFRGREGTEFLSMHPSWTYFARDYGLKQLSVHEENKSPSVKQLTELIDHASEAGIDVIFVQKEFAFQQTDVLARELNARVLVLNPLSEAWLENLRNTADVFQRVFDE
jgi:zinc transport system substrate-binding protein